MIDRSFIFLAGHHRSGTSLLHEIIREHPLVSGFSQSGVPEDEGQHLQSVYEPAKTFGGPGEYIYDKRSCMDENHVLATRQSAERIMTQWEQYYDSGCIHYIEKSPPNLIRTRFFQKLFPNSKFVVILRHPIAVSYATKKWTETSIKSLVEHSLRGYEIFKKDMPYLRHVYVMRYEEFVDNPQEEINKVYHFLDLEPIPIQHTIRPNVNEKYFYAWRDNRKNLFRRMQFPVTDRLEKRANQFGYSISNYTKLFDCQILGAHSNQIRPSV